MTSSTADDDASGEAEEAPPAWAKHITNALSSKPADRGRSPTAKTGDAATPRPPSPNGAPPAKRGRDRDTRQQTQFDVSGCFHCAGDHARKDCKAFQRVLESADINRGAPNRQWDTRQDTKVRSISNRHSSARIMPMPRQNVRATVSTHSTMGVMPVTMTILFCPTL